MADSPIHRGVELFGMDQDVHSAEREHQDRKSVAHIRNGLSGVGFRARCFCRFHFQLLRLIALEAIRSALLPCALSHKSVVSPAIHPGSHCDE
jgi:hypothetical protein